MTKLKCFNKFEFKATKLRKYKFTVLFFIVVSSLFFFASCSKPSSSTLQPDKSSKVSSETVKPETAKEMGVLGVIKVHGGAMLERDIIPQLSKVFSLSQDKVKEVLAKAGPSTLINPNLKDFRRMEGMIIPGEYVINEGSSLEEKVTFWIKESEKRYRTVLASNDVTNNLSPKEQLSLASIVEAECLGNAYHEEVATVFLNRLDDGSKLQSCVTAEYANGYQRPYLTSSDVAIESSYNTYFVKGLPLGPICAVSDASLKASINKKLDKKNYYFYYDYILNDMFFFSDYNVFLKEGNASRLNFEKKSPVGKRDKINKQVVYSKNKS